MRRERESLFATISLFLSLSLSRPLSATLSPKHPKLDDGHYAVWVMVNLSLSLSLSHPKCRVLDFSMVVLQSPHGTSIFSPHKATKACPPLSILSLSLSLSLNIRCTKAYRCVYVFMYICICFCVCMCMCCVYLSNSSWYEPSFCLYAKVACQLQQNAIVTVNVKPLL